MGTPIVCSSLPPYSFIISISSGGTDEEPCITSGVAGAFALTALIISMARVG